MAQDFEQALVTELSGISGLSGRVFPADATEGQTPPFIVYLSSYGTPENVLTGFVQLKEVPFEVNILSSTYTGMKPLQNAAMELLQGFTQRVIGVDGPFVQEIIFDDSPMELYEEEPKWYRCRITARVSI